MLLPLPRRLGCGDVATKGRDGEGKEQASPQCSHSVPGRSLRPVSLGEGRRERSQPQGAVGAGRRRLSRQQHKNPGRAEPSVSWVLSVGRSLGRAWALPSFLPFSGRSFPTLARSTPTHTPPTQAVNDCVFPSFFFSQVSSWVRVEGHPGRRFWKPHPEATQNKTIFPATDQHSTSQTTPAFFTRPNLSAGFPGSLWVGF